MVQNPTLRPLQIIPSTQPCTGMLYMIAAMLLLPVSDSFAKLISETLNPVGVTLCRVLAQAVFLIPIT